MTEAEWQACGNPSTMISYLKGRSSHRKFRLAACEFCRAVSHLFPAIAYHNLIECADHFADGIAKSHQLALKRLSVFRHSNSSLARAIRWVTNPSASYAAKKTAELTQRLQGDHCIDQSQILRDIFGNPFRSVNVDPCWLSSTVLVLARQMYDSRDFSAMPILADALQDSGCDNADILNHCRGPGPHVRGCWLLDKLLARE
jgi:hypothetical protein